MQYIRGILEVYLSPVIVDTRYSEYIIIIIYNDKCYFLFFPLPYTIINIVIGNAIYSCAFSYSN